jgi:ABC-type sugar transport system ATPase subunit
MIEIEHLSKRYGDTIVVDDVSFTVGEGEIAVVVGTSGAGKSTLLRMINRLVVPDTGSVLIDGQDTATIPEDELRHRIGYVIQGYGLFPHRTVAENIATAFSAGTGGGLPPASRSCSICSSSIRESSQKNFRINCPAASSSAWASPARLPQSPRFS